jgi:hypothetical protein
MASTKTQYNEQNQLTEVNERMRCWGPSIFMTALNKALIHDLEYFTNLYIYKVKYFQVCRINTKQSKQLLKVKQWKHAALKAMMSLGIVAYADNPLLGGRDCEDCGWRQKEFVTLHLNRKKNGQWWCTCHPSNSGKCKMGSQSRLAWAIS